MMENSKNEHKEESFNDEKNKDFLKEINESEGNGFKEETFVYQKKSNIKWLYRFAFVILIGFIAFILLNQKTSVIDFTGMKSSDAVTWGNNNKAIITLVREHSSDVEKDYVITQSVKAGEKIEKNMSIVVTISDGSDPFEAIYVPDFDQTWSRTSINRWLTQNGIENYNIKYTEDENVDEGYMISYRMIGATKDDFTRSSEIEFVICLLDDAETITMQDFLNKTILDVDIWAKKNDVKFEYSFEGSSIYSEDKIIYQSIAPNEEMKLEDTLRIIISSGNTDVRVEDFLNKTLIEVDSWSKKNGVNYTLNYIFSSIYSEDRIVSQSISVGEVIFPGDKIIFEVSKGEKIQVPDFSKTMIENAGKYSSEFNLEIIQKYISGSKPGAFISQSISAGSNVKKGSDLIVIYSLGGDVYIPDFRNKDITEIESWAGKINADGGAITLAVVEEANTGYEKGRIISQSSYNEKILLNKQIDIVVSESAMIQIPDFSTIREEEIVLGYAQLNVRVNKVYKSDTNYGDFISQSVKAGTMVEVGTDVIVEISIGSLAAIGDYKNKSLLELKNWIDQQNESGANITFSVYEQFSVSVGYGNIISHDKLNELIGINDEIKVIVSIGKFYFVTNFQYMSRQDIMNYARIYEINVVFEEVYSSDHVSGQFISQKPTYGEVISKNNFITITYAK